jgi:hypothetical protein
VRAQRTPRDAATRGLNHTPAQTEADTRSRHFSPKPHPERRAGPARSWSSAGTRSPEQHERYVEQLEQLAAGAAAVIEPLVERSGEHITEVGMFSRRLAIRRGPDDPVTKDLGAVLDAGQAMLEPSWPSRRC